MRLQTVIAAAGLMLALLVSPAVPQAADDPPNPSGKTDQIKKGSGLPVPRFASMRSDDVNVRTGPGTRYPVEWVFQRKNMPVEVISEFDTWRRIRDWQGATGWVHQSMLTGKRTAVVTAREAVLLRTPEAGAAVVARLENSVQGDILNCKGGFCRIDVQKHRGWIERKSLWGIYPNETID
jgi:SH3-like domain-containing protein